MLREINKQLVVCVCVDTKHHSINIDKYQKWIIYDCTYAISFSLMRQVAMQRHTHVAYTHDSVNWIEHRESIELCAFAWVIIYEKWQAGSQAGRQASREGGRQTGKRIGMKNLHFACHKIAIKIHLSRFNWKLLGLRSQKACV